MAVRWSFAAFARVTVSVLSLVLLGPGAALAAPEDPHVRGKLASLRLPFVANEGQVDAQVAYYARTFAGTLFVTHQGELVYSLPGSTAKAPRGGPRMLSGQGWTLTETLTGAAIQPKTQGRSATGVGSFLGNDRARWRPELAAYDQLDLGEAWPGVTVALRARVRSVEKVFTVEPGASVDRIRVGVGGADALSVDGAGALVAGTGLGPVTFTAPVAYQERDGVRREVAVAYRLTGREYGFTVGAYDRTLPLVIDPLLQSTYLGGGDTDELAAMAIHPVTGDVYVAGWTLSTDFPGTAGGAQPTKSAPVDAFVARLNSALTALIRATYLGGTSEDIASALAIHPTTGDVYVGGSTTSADFPETTGGAQPTFVGGGSVIVFPGADAFVARLNSALTVLTQATYFDVDPDNGGESVLALAIHPTTGDVYIAGETVIGFFAGPPPDLPADTRFSPAIRHEAFVARLNAALTVRIGAISFGDRGARGMAIHPASGDVYVVGSTRLAAFSGTAGGAQPTYGGGDEDAWVMRLPSALTAPIQSTYLGGSASDDAFAVAIHPATGDIYVAGATVSTDFPGTTGGAQPTKGGFIDAFVARLDSALAAITQATYLGGSDPDRASTLAIHPATGDVYVAGWTESTDFPGTTGGVQPTKGPGPGFSTDVFVARLVSGLATLIQATYLGGSDFQVAVALAIHPLNGDVFVAGNTGSTDFPGAGGGAQATNGGGGQDGFVSRLTFGLAAEDSTFADVLPSDPFSPSIDALFAAGITGGCATSPPRYCPKARVTRAEIAVFLLRGIHGAGFLPPDATGMFTDVPLTHLLVKWIEELAREGITAGCSTSPSRYCPEAGVTRGEMAVFLLRAQDGAGFLPPLATGRMFIDVPFFHPFARWIEELARRGITGGCGPQHYCPNATVTREEMAVFLVRAFNLPL